MSKILVEVLTKDDVLEHWVTDDDGYNYGFNGVGIYINQAHRLRGDGSLSRMKYDVTYVNGFWLRKEVSDYGKEPT